MTGKQIAAEIRKLPHWNQWGNLTQCVNRLETTWAWNEGKAQYAMLAACVEIDRTHDHVFQVVEETSGCDVGVERLKCLACGHTEDR